ncbi:hypothetical protein LguiA_011301 [Lonicera macranthoides]
MDGRLETLTYRSVLDLAILRSPPRSSPFSISTYLHFVAHLLKISSSSDVSLKFLVVLNFAVLYRFEVVIEGDEDNGRKSLNKNGTALLRLNVYRIYTHQKVQDSTRSKSLAVAGAEILIGTWVPVCIDLNPF